MRVLNKKYWRPELQIRLLDNEPTHPYGYIPKDIYVDERATWCKENLPNDQWYAYRDLGWKIFAFKDEADIVAFKLRWK